MTTVVIMLTTCHLDDVAEWEPFSGTCPSFAGRWTTERQTSVNEQKVPVVFIHGLWLHATSWTPWVEHFARLGYQTMAPEWPGTPGTVAEARTRPEDIAGHG